MATFLGFVGALLLISWASARVRGVPWMSWGSQTKIRTDRRRAMQLYRLRTKSIKPQSPCLQQTIQQPATEAFLRLTELTHSEQVSDRLICDIIRRNPGRDELWAAEKAIYDIERDRMA
ncbi:MAG: hypothetical protein AAFR25_02015 [Cyanobacteria bacterium J06629_19]